MDMSHTPEVPHFDELERDRRDRAATRGAPTRADIGYFGTRSLAQRVRTMVAAQSFLAAGNGVLARIVSNRQGQLAEWIIEPKQSAAAPITHIDLKAGEILDFIVESRGDENSDSYVWRAVLRAADGTTYGTQSQFHGPLPDRRPLTAWERYAQALLGTNEFAFVD